MARSFRQDLWNLPNAITLVRIAMIPIFLVLTWDECPSFLNGRLAAERGEQTPAGTGSESWLPQSNSSSRNDLRRFGYRWPLWP